MENAGNVMKNLQSGLSAQHGIYSTLVKNILLFSKIPIPPDKIILMGAVVGAVLEPLGEHKKPLVALEYSSLIFIVISWPAETRFKADLKSNRYNLSSRVLTRLFFYAQNWNEPPVIIRRSIFMVLKNTSSVLLLVRWYR
jgi:hypothetical protein